MLIDILMIIFLFLIGAFVSEIFIIIGLKAPLKEKNYLSLCNKCKEEYSILHLIPLISYFIDRGHCYSCKSKIPFWYIILELLLGSIFSLSFVHYGFSYEMIVLILISILTLIICVSDFTYYIILDTPLIIIGGIILLMKLINFGYKTFFISIASGIIIFIFMYLIKIFGEKVFRQESMGGGDVKLSAIFGIILGVRLSIITLILGSFTAFPYALHCSLSKNNKEIPFGPFLALSLILVFIFMEPIRDFLSIIFIGY